MRKLLVTKKEYLKSERDFKREVNKAFFPRGESRRKKNGKISVIAILPKDKERARVAQKLINFQLLTERHLREQLNWLKRELRTESVE